MTWSEVMSRITVHLTVASAALVVLALVTQATGFGVAFHVLSIGLTSAILALGTLTGVRVHNASREDAAIIVGMNRLRAAYVQMDPGIAEYLVTSQYDDQAGLMATYTMGMRRSTISHVIGSTSMFINIVNAIVAGTLGALIADAAAGDPVATSLAGIVAGVAYLATNRRGGAKVVFDDADRGTLSDTRLRRVHYLTTRRRETRRPDRTSAESSTNLSAVDRTLGWHRRSLTWSKPTATPPQSARPPVSRA